MRKLRLVWIGKTQIPFLKNGINLYQKKISKYINVSFEEIKPSQYGSLPLDTCRSQETLKILKILKNSEINIFLDENGKKESSISMAKFLDEKIILGNSRINFFIGGAYGFEKNLLPVGTHFLSLSDMTFTHQMVRLILLEQIFRAFTIINKEPYHND
tara:strand:- start:325 stop:798 length:474 start_codon:yes stop_codon:yes gene_type:complete